MRVTNKLMADTVISSFFKNTDLLLKTQNRISSGKKINKPSDDPIGISSVLDYRKKISTIDQYSKNINQGKTWLGLTDSTLADVDILLTRAKEVAVYQASETANEQTRAISAEEVDNIYDQMMQIANTKLGNSFIFAGHITDIPPFSRDDSYNASYNGDTGEIRIIVGEDVEMGVNIDGEKAFIAGINIFDVLRDLKYGLETDDTAAISDQIELLDDSLDQVLGVRSEVGAKLNRLESTENYWSNFKLNVEQMLSDTEDADIAKAMTELASQETAYQASLAASARVIQPSLIYFLS